MLASSSMQMGKNTDTIVNGRSNAMGMLFYVIRDGLLLATHDFVTTAATQICLQWVSAYTIRRRMGGCSSSRVRIHLEC